MPLFMIERNFGKELELSDEGVNAICDINKRENIRWVHSYLTADKKSTYCLYEAPDEDSIRSAALALSLPANKVTEVSRIDPPS